MKALKLSYLNSPIVSVNSYTFPKINFSPTVAT